MKINDKRGKVRPYWRQRRKDRNKEQMQMNENKEN